MRFAASAEASPSIRSRISKMSRRSFLVTPRIRMPLVVVSMTCSCSRRWIASRMGVRLTPSSVTRFISVSTVPRGNLPDRISFSSRSNTCSASDTVLCSILSFPPYRRRSFPPDSSSIFSSSSAVESEVCRPSSYSLSIHSLRLATSASCLPTAASPESP